MMVIGLAFVNEYWRYCTTNCLTFEPVAGLKNAKRDFGYNFQNPAVDSAAA